jgi:hypothetical protein
MVNKVEVHPSTSMAFTSRGDLDVDFYLAEL